MVSRGPKGRYRVRRGGVLGEGLRAPSHQLGGLGSAVSSPNGVRGGVPAQVGFCTILTSIYIDDHWRLRFMPLIFSVYGKIWGQLKPLVEEPGKSHFCKIEKTQFEVSE